MKIAESELIAVSWLSLSLRESRDNIVFSPFN